MFDITIFEIIWFLGTIVTAIALFASSVTLLIASHCRKPRPNQTVALTLLLGAIVTALLNPTINLLSLNTIADARIKRLLAEMDRRPVAGNSAKWFAEHYGPIHKLIDMNPEGVEVWTCPNPWFLRGYDHINVAVDVEHKGVITKAWIVHSLTLSEVLERTK